MALPLGARGGSVARRIVGATALGTAAGLATLAPCSLRSRSAGPTIAARSPNPPEAVEIACGGATGGIRALLRPYAREDGRVRLLRTAARGFLGAGTDRGRPFWLDLLNDSEEAVLIPEAAPIVFVGRGEAPATPAEIVPVGEGALGEAEASRGGAAASVGPSSPVETLWRAVRGRRLPPGRMASLLVFLDESAPFEDLHVRVESADVPLAIRKVAWIRLSDFLEKPTRSGFDDLVRG